MGNGIDGPSPYNYGASSVRGIAEFCVAGNLRGGDDNAAGVTARLDDVQNPDGRAPLGGCHPDDSVHDPAVYRLDGMDSVYAKRGYLQQWIPSSANWTELFFSFWGMVMIMSLHLFPSLLVATGCVNPHRR